MSLSPAPPCPGLCPQPYPCPQPWPCRVLAPILGQATGPGHTLVPIFCCAAVPRLAVQHCPCSQPCPCPHPQLCHHPPVWPLPWFAVTLLSPSSATPWFLSPTRLLSPSLVTLWSPSQPHPNFHPWPCLCPHPWRHCPHAGHAPVPWFPAMPWPLSPPWPGACPGPFLALPLCLFRQQKPAPWGPAGGTKHLPPVQLGTNRAGGLGMAGRHERQSPEVAPSAVLGAGGPILSGSCSVAAGGWDTAGTRGHACPRHPSICCSPRMPPPATPTPWGGSPSHLSLVWGWGWGLFPPRWGAPGGSLPAEG